MAPATMVCQQVSQGIETQCRPTSFLRLDLKENGYFFRCFQALPRLMKFMKV